MSGVSSIEDDDIPLKFMKSSLKGKDLIRDEMTGYTTIVPLPHDCCKFTYTAKMDLKGKIPKMVAESYLSSLVDEVRRGYNCFRRPEEVDGLEREHFIKFMEIIPQHTREERTVMIRALQHTDYRLLGGRVERYGAVEGNVWGGEPESPTGTRKKQEHKLMWKRLTESGMNDFSVKRFAKFKQVRARERRDERGVKKNETKRGRIIIERGN